MSRDYTLKETGFEGMPIFELHYDLDYEKLELEKEPFKRIVIHHTGSKDYSISDLIEYHMDKLKMGAIGYHFVIDSQGTTFYTRDLRIKGAHAFPNSGKIGIGFLRSFDKVEPNNCEIKAFKKFAGTLADKFNIDVLGHNQDQIVELLKTYPALAEQKEILTRLWVPESLEDFDRAKQELLIKMNSNEISAAILNIKTCPGINAYRGLM